MQRKEKQKTNTQLTQTQRKNTNYKQTIKQIQNKYKQRYNMTPGSTCTSSTSALGDTSSLALLSAFSDTFLELSLPLLSGNAKRQIMTKTNTKRKTETNTQAKIQSKT